MSDSHALLTLLPERRVNWSALAISFAAQAAALAVLVHIGILQPQKFEPVKPTYSVISLLVQTPPPQRPAPRPPRQMLPPPETPKEAPKLEARVLPPPPPREKPPLVAPRPQIFKAEVAKVLPVAPPRQQLAIVHTGAFASTGSQAAATLARPARDVQTGGFGDPNGVKGTGKPGARLVVANLGSFDLPSGPGYGNGAGGARGLRGTVASIGFGNGVAIGNSDHNRYGARGAIQQGGFGDVRPVAEARSPKPAAQAPVSTPVQVLTKPVPVYTAEARALKLEGEVLLEVAFLAKGQCQVVRVLRGLGHGLDEAAVRAAERIRFRPATRNGEPVDSTASLHVIFQLAY